MADIGSLETRLPGPIRTFVDGIATRPALTSDELRTELDRYAGVIERAGADDPFLDTRLGVRLIAACRSLVDHVEGDTPEHQRLVQIAVLYLVEEDDADPDLTDMSGFDDDALVVNLVAKDLGRKDLVVSAG